MNVSPIEGGHFSGVIHPLFYLDLINYFNRRGFYLSRKAKRIRRPFTKQVRAGTMGKVSDSVMKKRIRWQ